MQTTLRSIKLINKVTPAGEDESSRKTIYKISDNYLHFWYHFMFRDKSYLELIGPQAAASEIFSQVKNKYYYIFSKSGYTEWVMNEAERLGNIRLLGIDDIFNIN